MIDRNWLKWKVTNNDSLIEPLKCKNKMYKMIYDGGIEAQSPRVDAGHNPKHIIHEKVKQTNRPHVGTDYAQKRGHPGSYRCDINSQHKGHVRVKPRRSSFAVGKNEKFNTIKFEN